MRVFAVLSTIAITASLAIVVPGSVAENTALASTPQTCEAMHGTAEPALVGGSYVIDSVERLVYLSVNQDDNVPGTTDPWRTRNFIQTAPIDLDGCLWTPIGADDFKSFTGEYDGGHYPIHGLTIDTTIDTAVAYSGFFGGVSGAVSRVDLRNVNIRNKNGVTGAIAGTTFQPSGKIMYSSATGVITGAGNSVGGLVGSLQNESTLEFSRSNVSITLSGTGTSHGGLVGVLASGGTIANSYALGDVAGVNSVGSLVGQVAGSSTITNSFATGGVSGSSNLGGLVGEEAQSASTTITKTFWDITTSGTESAGGVGKTTTQLTSFDTFKEIWPIVDGWDSFDPSSGKVWGILADLNGGYPYLLWEYEVDPFACGPLVDGFHQISTPEQLRAVGIRGEESPCGLGDNYRQVDDITLDSSVPWTPIGGIDFNGSGDIPFTGHYDGGGKKIEGVVISSGGTPIDPDNSSVREVETVAGFFGVLVNAVVENVHIEEATIGLSDAIDSNDPIKLAVSNGGLLAGAAIDSRILDVHVSGSLDKADLTSGGLVGFVAGETEIRNCMVNVTVTSADDAEVALGGIVGIVVGDSEVLIAECEVTLEAEVNLAAEKQFDDLASLLGIGDQGDDPVGIGGLIGGAVGAVASDGQLLLGEVTLTGDSSFELTHPSVTDPDYTPALKFSAVGGLVGFNLGLLGIEDSHVGTGPHMPSSPARKEVTIDIEGSDPLFYAGGLVGGSDTRDGSGNFSGVVESSATTDILLNTKQVAQGAAGGLIGGSSSMWVEDNLTDTKMTITTNESELVTGGLIGQAWETFIGQATVSTVMTITANEADVWAGGLVGRADESPIELSSADVNMTITTNDADVWAGGLVGRADESPIELSSADVEMNITADEALVFAGGLVGFLDQDPDEDFDYLIRYSSSSGTITVKDLSGDDDGSDFIVAGHVAYPEGSSPITDSSSNVDIRVTSLGQDSWLAAGGAFGYLPKNVPVTNILSSGTITLAESVSSRESPDNVEVSVGSFAGVVDETREGQNQFAHNFARAGRALVGDGPDVGIAPLSDAEITTITPYRAAGWGIVPATASTVPAGPEDEVWVIATSGLCEPVLWWQWDMVKDGCFQTVTPGPQPDPETDPANPNTGDKDGSTSSPSASGSTRPGKTGSPAPSEDAGDNELPAFLRPFTPAPSTDDADLPEEPGQVTDAETDAGADAAAGGDTASPGLASDNGASAQSSAGLSTGALWAIGLGGVGAVALIAGGLAFARMRP